MSDGRRAIVDDHLAAQLPLEPPLLRGWLHLVCFFLAIPAAAYVVGIATDTRSRVGAVVYAIGLCALFGVSGTYHRGRWSPRARARMKRLDHATIFVMIAGTYTPLCLVALRHSGGVRLLALVWAGAVMGVVMAAVGVAERRWVGMATYVTLGWIAVVALPALAGRLGAVSLALVVIGGVVYTVGGIVLGTRWPNPSPRFFGYHEVWHVLVVAAAVCHFIAIAALVGPPR